MYELAQHFWLAEDRTKAFTYSLRGAELARATYANDVAIELFGRVLELLDSPDPSLSGDVDEKLGDLYALKGRFKDALARYRAVMAASSGTLHQARLLRKIASVEWQKGELGASIDSLWQAAGALGQPRPKSATARTVRIASAVLHHVLHRIRVPAPHLGDAERDRLLELAATTSSSGKRTSSTTPLRCFSRFWKRAMRGSVQEGTRARCAGHITRSWCYMAP